MIPNFVNVSDKEAHFDSFVLDTKVIVTLQIKKWKAYL